MSLERFCRARLVVQHGRTTAHDAAHAMEANHVGAVLVQDEGKLGGIVTDRDLAIHVVGNDLDPETMILADIMTQDVAALAPSASERDAAELMRARRIRRVPLVDGGRVVGLVTLDDLILDGGIELRLLAEIVRAQLEAPAARKPAGLVRPERSSGRQRAGDRAEERFGRMIRLVKETTGIPSGEAAETALEIVLGAIVRRITYQEAADLIAQLPSRFQDRLLDLPKGPDRTIDRAFVEAGVAERLDLDAQEAARVVHGVGLAIEQLVSDGELEDVRSQLPRSMREILPSAAP